MRPPSHTGPTPFACPMSIDNDQTAAIERSCRDFELYPENLLRTHKFRESLRQYHDTLLEAEIFHSYRRLITILTVRNGNNGLFGVSDAPADKIAHMLSTRSPDRSKNRRLGSQSAEAVHGTYDTMPTTTIHVNLHSTIPWDFV